MAVYTQLTNEQIAELIGTHYNVGQLGFAVGITQGVENSNYLIGTTTPDGAERKFILTLYEKRMNPAELPFFLGLMHHIAEQGIACPQPIPRRDGTLISDIANRKAALVSFLHGKSRTVIANAHTASVGQTLAALHLAVRNFAATRQNALSLAGWHALYKKLEGGLDAIQPGLESLVVDELTYLQNASALFQHASPSGSTAESPARPSLPQGIIHADLFPDNVFFEGDAVSGVIDFYFACTDALAYDLAITLNAWAFEPRGEFNPVKSKLLLANYQKLRPLNAQEIAAFPTLLRGAALRFLLTRTYDWLNPEQGAQVNPKNPLEYASKLRFHQQVKDGREYGF